VVAIQHLPPLQRAALLLREVVGFSPTEIAELLGATLPSVNSALQRARATVRDRLPARSQQATLRELGEERTMALVSRYAEALERGDVDTLVSMLTEDASWSMPPDPQYYRGHRDLREWLLRDPLSARWQHLPTRANGQLAVGCYLFDHDQDAFVPAVIDVLTLDGDRIASVTAFLATEALPGRSFGPWINGADLFTRFGRPATWS
jgi:RNA polymerase sigma-70 factor, ECF subfamily